MASDMELDHSYEISDLKHSVRTASLELSLERSKHSVEIVTKDEDIRKLRLRECLLQDEVDELHEQLEEEQARLDDVESALDDALMSLDQYKAEAELAQNQIRTQSREVANLKAELRAMENVTSDSNKILAEKLALNREMSSLRPEVEHLRAQVETNQGLLTEKLALQRQLTTLQVELENEKRSSARALAKQGRKADQDEELRGEVEQLRMKLAQEKKDKAKTEAALAKAEKATENVQASLESQQETAERVQAKLDKATKKEASKASKRDEERDTELEELRQELELEKSARKKAEKANKNSQEQNAELEELREALKTERRERLKLEKAAKKGGKDKQDHTAEVEELREVLETEKRERQKLEKAAKNGNQQDNTQTEAVQKELEQEKRDRKKAEKEFQKQLAEMQGKNTVLDDKLDAFREKLRTTKEKLKAKEDELTKAHAAAPAPATKPAKNARKRMAATAEPETTRTTQLDSPEEGFARKKAKRAISVSAIGDTSAFSLTPFLNRTGAVAAVSPIGEEDEDAEGGASPTAAPKQPAKKAAQPKTKPLAPSASSKANAKPRKKTPAPALEMVEEDAEESMAEKEKHNAPVTVPLKDADDGPSKSKPTSKSKSNKPRKSLVEFATFNEEPAPEKIQKKKRKLGGGNTSLLGKTLFDDEDEGEVPKIRGGLSGGLGGGLGGKGIFAARALGKSVLGKGAAGGSRPISGGWGMMSEQNFAFSPLKKDRKSVSLLKG